MTCCYRFGVSLRKLLGLHFFGDPLDDDATSLDLERLTPPIAVTLRKRRHKQTLTFVLISDTHMTHEAMVVPEGDVLLHAGDFGKWNSSRDDVMRFNAWLGRLPHPVKLITGGNHDRLGLDFYKAIFTNATFLANEAVFIAVARDGSVSVRRWPTPTTRAI